MRFLILDDNPDIIVLVSMMLQQTYDYCEIMTARNGEEGLAALNTSIPDVIISNVRMPMMDGLTFIREVRQNVHWSNIRVAAMSALNTPNILNEAKDSGAQAFLQKPFTYNDFKTVMSQLI